MTMKSTKLLKSLALGALAISLTACGAMKEDYVTQDTSTAVADHYASAALESGQYADAADHLEGLDSLDPMAKLNLALAYSNIDRMDEALTLYQEILNGAENPYVVVSSSKAPMRIKTVATKSLAMLDEG